MKVYSTPRSLFVALLVIVPVLLSAQGKQANNWYFGEQAGITFSTTPPLAVTGGALNTREGCATISNSDGDLLFYTDGSLVYNRNNQTMPHGVNLYGHSSSTQSAIIVPRPGSSTQYYIFTVSSSEQHLVHGLCYTKVDMQRDNGLGDVVVSEQNVQLIPYTCEKVTAVGHSDGESFWVITHVFGNSDFYSYRVTINGVEPDPVITTTGPPVIGYEENARGYLKVSSDGKWIVAANEVDGSTGFYKFNNTTGAVTHFVTDYSSLQSPYGVEFSPNNTYVYVSNRYGNPEIVQYNLSSDDPTLILNSKISMTLGNKSISAGALQLGPDNKIYAARYQYGYLSRINQPNFEGAACGLETDAVYLDGQICQEGLPPFIQSFFKPLIMAHFPNCASGPTNFSIVDPSGIDSVRWEFHDPDNYPYDTSTDFNPVYKFSHVDTFNVTLSAWSELGLRTITDTVIIYQDPTPFLGKDTLLCRDNLSLILEAGPGDLYNWNGSFSPGSHIFTVSDTGTYWVRVRNHGCSGYDTIHVALHPEVFYDDSQMVISPTTCGNSTGAIRGIEVHQGAQAEWHNSNGVVIGTTINISFLAVGNYFLTITDTTGCVMELPPYTINNVDSDLIIKSPDVFPAYCSQANGKISVNTTVINDLLQYSIDDGNTWYDNSGIFENVLPGSYFVRVMDSEGCEAVFSDNPVIVNNQSGLTVTGVTVVNETDNNADGKITIAATGDNLSFSLNASPPQPDGLFEGLCQGDYTLTVTDIHGCDSTMTVHVPRNSGYTLFASAGDTMVCNGQRGFEPLLVNNFKDITSFEITLHYNNLLLGAIGYLNAHPSLIAGLEPINYPSAGIIKIKWIGTNPVTLPDHTVLLDLVIQGKNPGLSSVDWVVTSNQTTFMNQYGVAVPVQDTMGSVNVSPEPGIWSFYQPRVCEYSSFSQMVIPTGGTGTSTVIWETPQGARIGPEYKVDTAGLDDAGLYRVKVIDQMHCVANDSVQVIVIPLPQANFPATNPTHDTIPFEQSYLLEATPGYASYEWNTGDTTYFINVTEEGEYSVIIQTAEGCTDTSAVMMVSTWFPVNVSNAFTPNGDWLNDTFKPIIKNPDLVVQYHFSIYNRWGQCFFETSNPLEGWDGKDELPGVYNWVLSYSNQMGKGYQLKGVVTLIK